MVKQKQCEMCGATMTNVGNSRKYCDACLKALRSKQADEHNKKQREARKKTPLPQGKTITDVCARAEAAGRTYGQQVEFERRRKELEDRGEKVERRGLDGAL